MKKELTDLFKSAGLFDAVDAGDDVVIRDSVVADFYKSYVEPKLAREAAADACQKVKKIAEFQEAEESLAQKALMESGQAELDANTLKNSADFLAQTAEVKEKLYSLLRECEETNNEKACYQIELAISSLDDAVLEAGESDEEE